MTENTNIDSTVEQALRKAREGAEEAGYGMRGARYANLDRRTTSTTMSATNATVGTVGTADTLRNRHKVSSDRLGVSIALSRAWVVLTYPPEMKHHAFIPMEWLTGEGNEQTAKIISLHCDPLWLADVIA